MHVLPQDSFSSYLNLEARFIMHKVSLLKKTKVEVENKGKINNLYRDDQIMTVV